MKVALTVAAVLATASLAIAATESSFKEIPPPSGHSLGSVTGGNFKMANLVIQKKCVSCHSDKVIRDAVAAGKNMQQIQQRMEQKGVQLSADDRSVLGIFWQNTPLKRK
jgi:uncharacterized membrane protein